MIAERRTIGNGARLSALLIAFGSADMALAGETYSSPLDLTVNSANTRLYIAETTANRVAEFDIINGNVVRHFALPGPPSGLALSADDSTLYVTVAQSRGTVCVVPVADGQIDDTIPVGHTPGAPVLSPDGHTLYVCNRFNNAVAFVDLVAGRVRATVPVRREPVAATLTHGGKLLFVANFLPAGRADADYVAAEVSVIDTASARVVTTIRLPDGSTALQAACMSPDGQYVYVTHTLARYQLPTTQLERGWVNTNAVSIIDVVTRRLANTVLLDDVNRGAANPWGVGCSEDGRYLWIAHAGTHELSRIDRPGLHERLAKAGAGERVTEVSSSAEAVRDDLAFLVDLRQRVKLDGRGPRGLAIAGPRIYAAEYFSDSLADVRIESESDLAVKSFPLGPATPLTATRRGAMLFHDATICYQQWQSCASCHPGDGRADGLNWDLLNDGIGNPKNTISLLMSHDTPPSMASGLRENAGVAVRAGIRHILLSVRPEADAEAIDAYLKSLKPVPSPHLVDGKLSDSARRGHKVFSEAGCADCHPALLHTDMNAYDVGTSQGIDEMRPFDTPSLIELWRTSPYLHDGRAATLRELLKEHNPNDRHGRTSDLTEQQVADLVEFLLSL